MAQDVLDVAIVGAGVSGVWSGWRLTDPALGPVQRRRVGVFELSDRIGGRLLSVHLPGRLDVACELGGMRYLSSQPLVKHLVEKVLALTPIPAPVGEDKNLAYLRGLQLRLEDLADPAKVPFRLTAGEAARIETLLPDAIAAIAPTTVGLTGDALRRAVETAEYGGRPLWQQGFWNLLAQNMSGEAFRFTQQSNGYDTTQLNWNAAETVVLNSDFGKTITYSRIKEGYEQVPIQLAARFEANGGEVHLRHQVKSLVPKTLPDGTTGLELHVEELDAGRRCTVLARSVILSMPRRSLELLDPTGAVMGDPTFRSLMTTVTPIPLFKAFVAYHEPWWVDAGVSSGRSVTDLPLRQVYYWTTEKAGNSILLATYDDTDDVGFWQGLATDPANYPLQTAALPPEARAAITDDLSNDRWEDWQAPTALVNEVHRELEILHGVPGAPPPYAAVYHDWIDDPFGGGVNFWNIGVQSWVVGPAIAHPVAGAPVYVTGEAYSRAQGWVEGALQTAEHVLTTYFGLAPAPVDPPEN